MLGRQHRRECSECLRGGGALDWELLFGLGTSLDKNLSIPPVFVPSDPPGPLFSASQGPVWARSQHICFSLWAANSPHLPTGPQAPAHIAPASNMQMSLALCKLVNANVAPDGSQRERTGEGRVGWDQSPGEVAFSTSSKRV